MINTRFTCVLAFAIAASSTPVLADSMSKEQCLDAHSRGQDARDQGKVSLARKLFLSCAQPACPGAVQNDCARFADDLTRQQPSLTFVARDAQGGDLPDTTVYVDDMLVVTRLDDGKPHDVDPGKHVVKFSNNGKDQTVTVVVGTGEKGRAVVANFMTVNVPLPTVGANPNAPAAARKPEPHVYHPIGSKLVIGGGIGAVGIGALLTVVGVLQVPSSCSISTSHCAAAPGDKVFDDAKSGMDLVNAGIIVGTVGVVAVAGGLYWYFSKAHTEKADSVVAAPYVTGDGAGFAVAGHF
jgi:hypothetical protein